MGHAAAMDRRGLLGGSVGVLVVAMAPSIAVVLVGWCIAYKASAAKDLGVLNIAGALPFSLAPAVAPAVLAVADGRYGVLFAVAGVSALLGAAAVLPVRAVR